MRYPLSRRAMRHEAVFGVLDIVCADTLFPDSNHRLQMLKNARWRVRCGARP